MADRSRPLSVRDRPRDCLREHLSIALASAAGRLGGSLARPLLDGKRAL